MSAFVFLGAFKVNSMQDTSSINVGSQILFGLESASTTKVGGSRISGDANPINAPVGLGINTDVDESNRLFSDENELL